MPAISIQPDFIAQCRQILDRFAAIEPTATIVPLVSGTGFSGARICRVTSGGRDYALRCWPIECPEPARIRGLHRLLEGIHRAGIHQVAVPIKARDGSSLVSGASYWWQLEPWLPGVADFHRQPTRERLRSAMQVLARWHLAAQSIVASEPDSRWFAVWHNVPSTGLIERRQQIKDYLARGESHFQFNPVAGYEMPLVETLRSVWNLFRQCAPRILLEITPLCSTPIDLQPCLRDVWHDHLLFTDDDLTGLIDPSACRSENVATDLARLLGSLLEDDRTAWASALSDYQAIRPLSLTETRLLRAFDTTGVLLSGITWLDWLLVQHRSFPDPQQVHHRLAAIVRRLENLRDQ